MAADTSGAGDGVIVFAKSPPGVASTSALQRVSITDGSFETWVNLPETTIPLAMIANTDRVSMLMTANQKSDLAFQGYDRKDKKKSIANGIIASALEVSGAALFQVDKKQRAFYLAKADASSTTQIMTTLVQCQ